MARVRRSPEEARRLILEAAETVFMEVGDDAFGTAEVARVAGVSRPLVAHYFGSRDELLEAMLERRLAAVSEEVIGKVLAHDPAAGGPPLPQVIMEILHSVFERYGRLLLFLVISGRADRLWSGHLSVAIQALHATRVERFGEVPLQDTLFTVISPLFGLLLHMGSGDLVSKLAPDLDSSLTGSAAYRDWLAKGLVERVEGDRG